MSQEEKIKLQLKLASELVFRINLQTSIHQHIKLLRQDQSGFTANRRFNDIDSGTYLLFHL